MTKEGSVVQTTWTLHEQLNFSLYVFKCRPCDPSKKPDLAVCYKSHQSRALYDLIWPTWWKKKDAHLHQQMYRFTTNLYLLPPLPSKTSPTERWETLFTPCFYTKSSYPIFPLVTFRNIFWEQGQKASRHIIISTENLILSGWQQTWHEPLARTG